MKKSQKILLFVTISVILVLGIFAIVWIKSHTITSSEFSQSTLNKKISLSSYSIDEQNDVAYFSFKTNISSEATQIGTITLSTNETDVLIAPIDKNEVVGSVSTTFDGTQLYSWVRYSERPEFVLDIVVLVPITDQEKELSSEEKYRTLLSKCCTKMESNTIAVKIQSEDNKEITGTYSFYLLPDKSEVFRKSKNGEYLFELAWMATQ